MSNLKKTNEGKNVIENPWAVLREYTDARIALGRVGTSIPTSHLLDFQLAHAQAQDAVHLPLDDETLVEQLENINLFQEIFTPIQLHSQAANRTTYLQRPDLGRRLDKKSVEILKKVNTLKNEKYDLSIVIVDGLSSLAIKENAAIFIKQLIEVLNTDFQDWNIAPITIVKQGRVAIGDEVGEILNSKTTIVLIGERPGLSSPDSMGLYLTYNPKVGLTDETRNCISNIRIEGLSYEEGIKKAMYLLKESRKLGLSGVNLKDRTTNNIIENNINEENFLLK